MMDGDVCRCRKRYPTGPPGASVEKGFWVLCLESAASMLYSFFRRGKRSAKIKKDITQTNEECGCRSKRRRRHPWCQRGPNQRNVVCHRRCCTGLRRRTRGRLSFKVSHPRCEYYFCTKQAERHSLHDCRTSTLEHVGNALLLGRSEVKSVIALPREHHYNYDHCTYVGEYDGLVGDHFGDEAEYGAEPGEVGEYLGDVGE
jgi:hypothetical protein